MRQSVFALCGVLLAASVPFGAQALPVVPAPSGDERTVIAVQNRFLPGFLGGEREGAQPDNAQVRLDQLEAQVRMLTGQVEQLTFTVRRLEQALGQQPAQGQPTLQQPAPGQQGALSGPGAPPRDLGTLPGVGGTQAPVEGSAAVAAPLPAESAPAAGTGQGGPIDLSALNQGVPQNPATPEVAPAPVAAAPAPAQNDALSNVRQLQQSGRYAMAAEEARAVLSSNPAGPVAGEARFLLGEALLAQGDYRGAANQFLENYTNDPNSPRAPESLLRLGTSLNGLGEREAACSSLEELFGAYPNVSPEVRAAAERERDAANCA